MTNNNNKSVPLRINEVDENVAPNGETRLQERARLVIEQIINACAQYITSNNQYYNQFINDQALILDAREQQLQREIFDVVEQVMNQLLNQIDQM